MADQPEHDPRTDDHLHAERSDAPDPQAPLAPHDAQGIDASDPRAPIEHVLDVPVSRARAYDAYVLGLGDWWHPGWTSSGSGLDRIEVDAHEGGRIVEHARDGRETVWGDVLEAEAGSRFSHTFGHTHEGSPSTVTVTFADLPHGGTRVLFQHGGWDESNQAARAKHTDWPLLLDRFRTYATHQ